MALRGKGGTATFEECAATQGSRSCACDRLDPFMKAVGTWIPESFRKAPYWNYSTRKTNNRE